MLARTPLALVAAALASIGHVVIGPDVYDLAGNAMDQDDDGRQGETTVDTYDASFNLVDVDLTLTNVAVAETELWAGETMNVSWDERNQNGMLRTLTSWP